MTLKLGQGRQNLINSFSPPNNVSMKALSNLVQKIMHGKEAEAGRRESHKKQYGRHPAG